ncbi:hypothetical protein [Streptomyces spiramyceticus]|uniref:hypothetical protein n=1 Tax=Streptomyces spiramyceticus TaxID=299717 RepID=UPI00237B4358|nr:hypothetical protein [Streptomyces spiramyceticus]
MGVGASAFFQYLGYQLLLALPASGAELLWRIPLTVLGVGLAAWTVLGLRWALASSWFSRNANWLVPAVIAPLYFLLPWFGRLLYTLYLTVGFGIPVEAVPVTTYSMMYAALKPVGLAAGFALLFVAAAGWARHAHWGRVPGGGIPSFIFPVVAVQYILTALIVGLITAGSAWGDAAEAVRSGRNPAGYYGLHGTLMCVTPHSKDIAVYNGPLITDRAVLTFGSTGERIWLWGLQDTAHGKGRWAATSVRLEDISLAPSRAGDVECPRIAK